ncbi:outer membrane beta-barrel protein [Runella sp. CRIBMP]|uniref:outer membrane beta-barrel protein n=1 Tax=Runella sp. CRIBMP TaxID=2683261 RepID=UPI0014126C20|nr:outer membrane beta-barrel protein [Runella sp. CRIBMP]NBB18540.1 outer membrane beta-barrel protein [Runella sp. CRIBMP]
MNRFSAAAFLLFVLSVFQALGQVKGTIKGRALDGHTRRPVEFASVALLSAADSSMVKGALTDTSGVFVISNLTEGNYLLILSSIEYQKICKGPLLINSSQQEVDLGDLAMVTDQKLLEEVIVKGNKPVFEQKLGTIIVNVDSKMFKTSANALEILRRSPGLLVDMSGNVTFRGTSPKILIDGKDLRMTGEQEKNYLRSLAPEQIESIELMPNPPAKYEASYQTVINVKLKRDQNLGLKGSVYGSYRQHRFSDSGAGGNITFKAPKMAYLLNLGVSNSNWFQNLTDRRMMGSSAQKDIVESFAFIRNPTKSLNFFAGAEYTLNAKNSIDFKLTGDFSTSPNVTYAENKSTIQGVEQPFLVSNNQMSERTKTLTGLLGYRYQTNNGREFIAEVAMADNRKPGSQDLISEYYRNDQPVRGISRQRNEQQANSNFKTLNVNYADLIFKQWKLETGFKINYVQNAAKIAFDTLTRADATKNTPLTDADFRKDAGRSNEFRFDENITMFFLQMSRQFKKLGFTAGIRAENTVTQGESVTLKSLVDRNYWNILPSLTLQYKINDNSNLVWASSRKLSRPTVWQLNPFPFFIDPLTVAMGNPFLFPRIRNVSELTYTYKNLMLITGYNLNQNTVSQLPLYNAATRLTTWQQVNTQTQRVFFDVSHSAPILPKWNYQMYLSAAYGSEKVRINARDNQISGLSASLWVSNLFTLPKGYNLEVSGWYNVPNPSGFYKSKGMGAVNMGLQKSFKNNCWNAQLNINDIFLTSIFRAHIQVDNSDMTFINRQANRNALLRITHNFGKSKYQTKGRKSGVSEDAERLR